MPVKKRRPASVRKVVPGKKDAGPRRGVPVLSDRAKQYVITALAGLAGPRQIVEGLREKFGVSVSFTLPIQYRKQHKEEIEALRRPWLAKLIDTLPLRHKAIRLRELSKLYEGCVRVVMPEGAQPAEGLLQEVAAPPKVHLGLYERMQELLAAIRREAGDDVQVVDMRLPISPEMQAQLDELVEWIRRRDDAQVLELYRAILARRGLGPAENAQPGGDGQGVMEADSGPSGDGTAQSGA